MTKAYTKTELKQAITECGGNVSAVAERFGKTRQTIYSWIAEARLWDVVNKARNSLHDRAVAVISDAVDAGDFDAAKLVVTSFPSPNRARWSSKAEVSATFAGSELSPQTIALLNKMGVGVGDVAQQFEELVRVAAAERGIG